LACLDPDPLTQLNPKLSGQVFQCGQCEVSVGSEYLLKVHEKTHVTEATPCNLCGKVVKVRAPCFLHISSGSAIVNSGYGVRFGTVH
jgi:hypothetical protein